MKVAILADTHAGVRNNSPVFMNHQIRFFEEVFFPYVKEHNIKHMIHLGDIFDRRKDTNNFVIYEWDRRVFAKWDEVFEQTHIIIGNHDTYFKNTNSVNTPEKFLGRYDSFRFYAQPQELNLYGVQTLMLPWICEENKIQANEALEESQADLVLGHLEIIGCPMFRGIENPDKGIDPGILSKFKRVLSGHFHLKSHQKNIDYLGSPVATMWAEAFDSRGFHVIDMTNLRLNFIENPSNPFVHIDYADSDISSIPECKDKIVRVLIKQKSSESGFLQFLEAIESKNPSEVNVSEQASISRLETKADEGMDLFSLMDLYVDSLDFESPKAELKGILRELYHEALNLHDISE